MPITQPSPEYRDAMRDGSTYTVAVDGQPVEVYARLETAIRVFDALSTDNHTPTGSIGVITVMEGVVVRNGYILRVEEGRTYLNPNLALLA